MNKYQNPKMPGNNNTFTVCALTFSLIALLLLSISGFAQRTTGTLRGQVLDPQDAAVANAEVTVTNQATGVSEKLTTTSAGTYQQPSILPGKYTVAVSSPGFKEFVLKDVTVLADQDNVADAHLDLGSASETVEVTTDSVEVQTTSSSLNNSFDSNQVLNVPVTGGVAYSALNLAILAPNTIATPGGTQGTGGAIGGTRPRDNNFTVDGVDDNNLGVTGSDSTVIFDAIQEFSLQTNQFSAEYGHSAGGQFNLVTKTGTNNFHGTGEGYFQNRHLNSLDNLTKAGILNNTPGLTTKPAYDDNRFGGTLGGPIIKNKWFVFGAYEYTDLHGAGSPTTLDAPTAAGISLLEGMAADSAVLNVLKTYPVAPSAGLPSITVNGTSIPVGALTIVSPVLQKEHDAQFNTDYSLGKHQLGARFLFNQIKEIFPVNSTQAVFNQNLLVRNRKVSLSDVWSINSNWVNDLRLQYSYFAEYFQNPCASPGGSSGAPCPQDVTLFNLGNSTVGPGDNQFQKQNTYQLVDNIAWAHGKHTFKFGVQYMHFIYPQFFLSRSTGDNWYSSTQEFINDLIPSQPGRTLRNAGTGFFDGTQSAIYGFAQDDIKVTPRLTLNLGARYEFWTNPAGDKTQQLNAISNVPGVINFGVPKTDKNNIAPRVGFAYDPTGSGKTAIRGGFGIAYDVKFQNFASITLPPQLQTEFNPNSACALPSPPVWCATGKGFLANGGLPTTFPAPATAAAARNLTTSYIDDTVMPKILTWSLGVQHELRTNSTIEVRYLGTRGLELPVQSRRNFRSYFDVGGTALPTYLKASGIPSTYTASTPTDTFFNNFACLTDPYGNCTVTPSLANNNYFQYGYSGIVTSDPPLGSSIYHAGSVEFKQRTGHGLSFDANYTYSHTIDTATNEFHTSALNPRRAEDTNQIGNDRGNSDLDVPHKFALSLSYNTPKLTTDNHFIGALVNGYLFGSSFIAQSGQPVTLQSGIDSNGNGDSAGDRVVFNPSGIGNTGSDIFPVCEGAGGNTYVGTTTVSTGQGLSSVGGGGTNGCNINPLQALGFDPAIGYTPVNQGAKYILAGPGARTTVDRNSFRSPGFYTWNVALGRDFHLTESKYFQVQAQVFNVLNHPNYALSNGNVFSNGGITTALATPGYAIPTDPSFLQPKQFGGGIRSMILAAHFFF